MGTPGHVIQRQHDRPEIASVYPHQLLDGQPIKESTYTFLTQLRVNQFGVGAIGLADLSPNTVWMKYEETWHYRDHHTMDRANNPAIEAYRWFIFPDHLYADLSRDPIKMAVIQNAMMLGESESTSQYSPWPDPHWEYPYRCPPDISRFAFTESSDAHDKTAIQYIDQVTAKMDEHFPEVGGYASRRNQILVSYHHPSELSQVIYLADRYMSDALAYLDDTLGMLYKQRPVANVTTINPHAISSGSTSLEHAGLPALP